MAVQAFEVLPSYLTCSNTCMAPFFYRPQIFPGIRFIFHIFCHFLISSRRSSIHFPYLHSASLIQCDYDPSTSTLIRKGLGYIHQTEHVACVIIACSYLLARSRCKLKSSEVSTSTIWRMISTRPLRILDRVSVAFSFSRKHSETFGLRAEASPPLSHNGKSTYGVVS
jgi:hypothetical protein